MTEYINVGAYVNGQRPKSKKALKDALSTTPWLVKFDGTSMFNPPGPFTVDEVKPGEKLQVTGPDPYNSRKWYATVEVKDGKVRVS